MPCHLLQGLTRYSLLFFAMMNMNFSIPMPLYTFTYYFICIRYREPCGVFFPITLQFKWIQSFYLRLRWTSPSSSAHIAHSNAHYANERWGKNPSKPICDTMKCAGKFRSPFIFFFNQLIRFGVMRTLFDTSRTITWKWEKTYDDIEAEVAPAAVAAVYGKTIYNSDNKHERRKCK